MMAHLPGAVVYLQNTTTKEAIRGYDHVKAGPTVSETVYLPFGTEYGVGYKIQDGIRRRLELRIDGTLVTDSLILSESGVIERFVDSDKKFKFVPVSDSQVSDPTSTDNGILEVRLYSERPQAVYRKSVIPSDSWTNPGFLRSRGYSDRQPLVFTCSSASMDTGSVQCSAQAGATVEGAQSSQTFGSTVWRGDASPVSQVFRFRLLGKTETPAKKAIQCPYCETFNKSDAPVCRNCGAEFVR